LIVITPLLENGGKKYMEQTQEINRVYGFLSEELDIPDSLFEKANLHYKSLGEYLSNYLKNYDIDIFPQGSMRLGTTIKPINEEDDYDLDAVCKVNGNIYSPEHLKNLIGDVLKESDRYSSMLSDEEGKRCWTIEYSDNENFHMDILPAISANSNTTELKITHKENGIYEYRSSDPEAYATWFFNRQKFEYDKILNEAKFSQSVEELKRFRVRTTLQKTIQILKRYRDIQFADDNTNSKPISIIITTLVAQVYTGNENIFELINKFSNEYMNYIKVDENGDYRILNPINEKENFADKWKIYPERKKAFFNWIDSVKSDLVTQMILEETTISQKFEVLTNRLGKNTINNVIERDAFMKVKNRESGNLFISNNSNIAGFSNEKTDVKVREHTFYGN